MKIFLSYSFSKSEDTDLVTAIKRLLESHNVDVFTGRRLAGGGLTDAIKKKIDRSDALVALLTQRDELADGEWRTHPWVIDELRYAQNQDISTIAIYENGVKVEGMNRENEYLPLNREQFLPTILDLSETISIWKQNLGNTLRVQLLFEEDGNGIGNIEPKCFYRFGNREDISDWRETNLIDEERGFFSYIKGVQEQYLIQVKIENGDEIWVSSFTQQSMPFQLKRQETDQ